MDAVRAKAIFVKSDRELGFVNRAALEEAERKKELEGIPDIGAVHFHHRQDKQTTIRSLSVLEQHRGQGWGRLLFYRVLCSAIENGCDRIFLKCPADLPSNSFYSKLGFQLVRVEPGKKRALNCWEYKIKLPLLFHCGDAGGSPYDSIVKESNAWHNGIRSDKRKPESCKFHCVFVDNNWEKFKVDFDRAWQQHIDLVKYHKPMLATVQDIELSEQLPQVLEQAKQIAPYCGRVLLIPKTKVPLPVNYWLAYSIQTTYGGTDIEPEWFGDRYVHLLGGSPNNQADSFRKFPRVVSLDGNYSSHFNVAGKGKSTWQGYEGRVLKGCYPSFQLSIEMQRRYWHKDYECPYCLSRPSKCLACFKKEELGA